ncbi:MAG: pilus assembly protein PilP [Thermodesulfobacteriota bacterium]
MHRQLLIATMIFLFALWFGPAGCGKQPDDSSRQSTPVAKKIIPQQTKADQGTEAKTVQTGAKPPASATPASTTLGSTTPESAAPTAMNSSAAEQPPGQAPPADGQKQKAAVASADNRPPLELYNPAGKLDPFAPLFKEEQVVTEDKSQNKKKKRRGHLTPLEKVDLSQLVLLGTILAPSGNRAMVADTSGKGYVITNGTYIGMSSGRVVDILKDRIVVEEEVENILGKISLRKRELKIQKPLGE